MLLIESIASVFSKQDSNPAISPVDSKKGRHNDSTSTNATEHMTITSRDLFEEEKAEYITPGTARASRKLIVKQDRSSDASGSTLLPGEVTGIAADPMANHTEGGINYRSLHWW
jgi:hypothetical protein